MIIRAFKNHGCIYRTQMKKETDEDINKAQGKQTEGRG